MSRRKKKRSIRLDRAEARLAALMSIQPAFEFGQGLSTVACQQAIDQAKEVLAQYNALLSLLDDAYSSYLALGHTVSSFSEQMLFGVAMQSGKATPKSEMAGGTRKVSKWEARSGSLGRLKGSVTGDDSQRGQLSPLRRQHHPRRK